MVGPRFGGFEGPTPLQRVQESQFVPRTMGTQSYLLLWGHVPFSKVLWRLQVEGPGALMGAANGSRSHPILGGESYQDHPGPGCPGVRLPYPTYYRLPDRAPIGSARYYIFFVRLVVCRSISFHDKAKPHHPDAPNSPWSLKPRDLRPQTPPYEGPTPPYEGPGSRLGRTFLRSNVLAGSPGE